MKKYLVLLLVFVSAMPQMRAQEINGAYQKWHTLSFSFKGPKTEENAQPNPFTSYRLDILFENEDEKVWVPGYFAADGDAANTSASKGHIWRVHFTPNKIGKWTYKVRFLKGENVAVSDAPELFESAGFMDGITGEFEISASDKAADDLRAKGRLQYNGTRYLRFAETGEVFLKTGADAPENLLAYQDFDGTFHTDGHKDHLVKKWEAHLQDWRTGDPTWQDGKGKALIGAINYLAAQGMNAFSFLTLNIVGDDQNVFPYVDYTDYTRFDVSKLAQWEIIFAHGERKGMFLHFKTQEVENQGLLDKGDTGRERRLYYRELMARFGHHLALNWNLGEENGLWTKRFRTVPQTTAQRIAMADYFAENDPYQHHLVIHNGQYYDDLLGNKSKLTGISLQTHQVDFRQVHPHILHWLKASEEAGRPWVVSCDEPGDAKHSLVPDKDNPTHDVARAAALWGTFMAGGTGVEWYFGYDHEHSDLTCEDWRSRHEMWQQSRYALQFFRKLPVDQMIADDDFVAGKNDYCFYKKGEIYVIYQRKGEAFTVDLPKAKTFNIRWYNPRTGKFVKAQKAVQGGLQEIAAAPELDKDWTILIEDAANTQINF
ncbi:DUF5060 domain-containing protein [Sediminitomix flava]|uniref:Collagenase-like protein with putative collagen-binding domain n=1 Tax=Sediminitomix flava TaxID=379075 RepID=A0A315Z5Q1_SEDFL|nr:DUF5060 domain-containing protein [Sediminitomix flava]PWJ37896.1 collagenase-like protein with putative collagen-binding domain [Sediminitomix flava]